ncbi:hypothetical protein C8A05DRAFT_40299 [Staphylotrichum tortipilum]|uniref:Uncharacterized protein n=1 Tax=Staphylotrichum tortipilum TaxID=2831512 RepID=A0AAN6MW23_9PEZI|nr:hypothetical protein C8A05DRAFT_40299 [Staphylotrichum longicolle]
MAPTFTLLSRRYENCTYTDDGYIIEDGNCDVPFWISRTGVIVKWSLFLGIILICSLYLLIGYIHVQKRIQKGLPPLGYHRFLVSRATLAQVDPRYRPPQPANIYPYHPGGPQYYDMHAVPPPVYDPNAPRPPVYEPPAGSTKVDPQQQQQQQQQAAGQSQPPAEERFEYGPPPGSPPASSSQLRDTYAPPPGPPPSAVRPQGTGNTNPFRD